MDLSYPIGRPQIPEDINDSVIQAWIGEVESTPTALNAAVSGLNAEQLDTPYRPDGWTVRQVAHHLADTHLHTFTNFKLALTEENPITKPIDINAWATLVDSTSAGVQYAVMMFEGIQMRWATLLRSMSTADFGKTIVHPRGGPRRLDSLLGVYAWHGKHHVAHITALRDRMNW